MTNKETIKKQIVYRSKHRGTKEMDLLLGCFVNKYINTFNYKELIDLNNLISMDDEVIYKWYFNKNPHSKITENKVSLLLKNFKLTK